MWIVLFLISIILLSFVYNNSFKIKEKFTLLISISTMMIWGVLFSILDMLKEGICLMYILLIIGGIIYSLKNKSRFIEYLSKLPLIVFVVGTIISSILYKIHPPFFLSWDEFSHWGPFLFNIKETNALHIFSERIFVHQAYPQAMTILYYLGSFFKGEYSESDVYLIYTIFIHTCTIVIVPNISYKEKKLISILMTILVPFFLYALPYAGYAAPYTSVYLDAILGAYFGAIMYFIIDNNDEIDKKENTLCSAILFFVLLQLKDVGIAFYLICLATYVIGLLSKIIQRKNIRSIWTIFFVTFFPLLGKIVWSYCLKITSKSKDQFSDSLVKKFLSIIIDYKSGKNEYFIQILNAFWNGIKNVNISWERTSILVIAFAYLVISIWISYKYYTIKKEKIVFIELTLFVAYFICYLFMLFVIYLCAMPTDRAMNNASMDRYLASFFMGWGFLILALIINYLISYRFKLAIGIIVSLIIFIYVTIPLNTIPYYTNDKASTGILWCEEKTEIIKEYIEPNDKIWFVQCEKQNRMFKAIFFYKLMPCYVDWNLPIDVSNLSIDDILETAKKANIDYLLVMDSNIPFIDRYCKDIVEKGNGNDNRVMIFDIGEKNIIRLY